MRNKDIKGIMNDLLELRNWKTPLHIKQIPNRTEINLLTGKVNLAERDSVTELLEEKREWFKQRIRNLKGKLSDFEKAKITIFGSKEKVEMIFKNNKFEKERIFEAYF